MCKIALGFVCLAATAFILSMVPAAFSEEISSDTIDLGTTTKPINEIGAFFKIKEIYEINKYVTIKPIYDVASYFKVKDVYDVTEYYNVKPVYEVGSYYRTKDLYIVGGNLPAKSIVNIGTAKKSIREI